MNVRGVVTDNVGDPIPGVTVLDMATREGTITDIDGNYSLSVRGPQSVLHFSFVGMESVEVVVGNRSVINIVLSEASTDL